MHIQTLTETRYDQICENLEKCADKRKDGTYHVKLRINNFIYTVEVKPVSRYKIVVTQAYQQYLNTNELPVSISDHNLHAALLEIILQEGVL